MKPSASHKSTKLLEKALEAAVSSDGRNDTIAAAREMWAAHAHLSGCSKGFPDGDSDVAPSLSWSQ